MLTGFRLLQIDILKALSIIFVLLGHTFSYRVEALPTAGLFVSAKVPVAVQVTGSGGIFDVFTHWITYSALFTQQAVPVFIAIMAYNFALSYNRRSYTTLSDIFSKNEYLGRVKRILIPFIVLYVLSLVVAGIVYLTGNGNILEFSGFSFLGYLPINGQGNYYMAILLQFLVLFPFLFIAYRKKPKLTLIGSFVIALAWEYITSNFISGTIVYIHCILRFLPLITLSLWITEDYRIVARRNIWIPFCAVAGAVYLIAVGQFIEVEDFFGLTFRQLWASQNLFASVYEIFLVMLGLQFIPFLFKKVPNILNTGISYIGKASFHIFLFQIIYFGTVKRVVPGLTARYDTLSDLFTMRNLGICLLALGVCLGVGSLLYYLENRKVYLRLKKS